MDRSVITGTGSYIPEIIKTNIEFAESDFYAEDTTRIETDPHEVVEKFEQITGIHERRYVEPGINASDIATIAGAKAIADSGIDAETIDQIIVAHNFGNVLNNTIQGDSVPSLASRVKQALGIKNPSCIPYDILFGCPGWVQGMVQANAFFKAGMARNALVIGSETLSRVIDPHDRDSMIFSDGAGACILEWRQVEEDGPGILGYSVQSHASEETYFIYMGVSNLPDGDPNVRYLKMKGRKVYEYAIRHVGLAMKDCLDKSGVPISDLKKIFIHQANEKLDTGIIRAFYKLYNAEIPADIMPMSIHWLGNSSVATIPTLYDLVKSGLVKGHELLKGDIVLFASVGAGMNINAICYRI